MDIRLGYTPLSVESSARAREEMIAAIRAFASTRLSSRLADERRCFAPPVVLELGNRGVFGMWVDAAHGGTSLRLADSLRVFEQLAAVDLSLSQLVGVSSLAIRPIAAFGSARHKSEWLRDLATGRMLASYAQTEPGAGSDYTRMASVARRQPDGAWLVRGDKTYIGNAGWAGILTVVAHLESEQGELGAFLVRTGTPGLRVGPELMTSGLRGVVQNLVHLEDVRVEEADRLPSEVMNDAMTLTRLQIAASARGGILRCIQLLERFASRRTVATGRLVDNVVIGGWLADMLVDVSLLDMLVYRAAGRLDRGETVAMEELAAIKVIATEALGVATDRLVQGLGSRGYDEATGVPQMVRDARVMRIFEGPTEALTLFLGARAGRKDRGIYSALEPVVASELSVAIERIPPGATEADGQLRLWQAGALTLAALERSASRVVSGALAVPAAARSEARWNERLRASPSPVPDAISELCRAATEAIGAPDQDAPPERWEVDPLLRANPTEARIADPKAPKRAWLW